MNNKLVFIEAEQSYEDSDVVIFGAPMDTTTTNRPGTRFGPNQARLESYGLETYSPYLNRDLIDSNVSDYGDIDLTFGDSEKQLEQIEELTSKIINDNKVPLMIGGEHLVTLGAMRAFDKKYDDIHIIQFDAHCDLRKEYMGIEMSHASVMYHVRKLNSVSHLNQLGIRSGTKEEFKYAEKYNTIEKFNLNTIDDVIEKIKNENVYITIDLDVLDTSVFSGTGTPEPGGVTYTELQSALNKLTKLNNIIGCDVVELNPQYDTSGVSNAVCAKVIREMILILNR